MRTCTFLLLAFLAAEAHALIAVDSVSTVFDNNPTSLTVSHTTGGGSDRLMIVGVSMLNQDLETVSSVTYNGIGLTFVGQISRSNDSRVELWSLLNPPAITASVVVTFNEQVQLGAGVGVVTFTGVDQLAPYGFFQSSTGNSNTASATVVSAVGETVIGVMAAKQQDDIPAVVGGNAQWTYKTQPGNDRTVGAGATFTGAGSVNLAWNLNEPDDWAIGAISLRDASPSAPSCDTFRDEFSSISYSRQDGTLNWAADWNEVGDDGSPASGTIQIGSNSLQFAGNGSTGTALGGPYIEREANLSIFSSATLSFDYRETGNWEPSDDFEIYVSGDGGASWNLIQTFSNDQGATFQSFTTDITAYISNNTRIAFVEKANNASEVFYIDDVQIVACATSPVGVLDHFRITPAAIVASTCLPNAVTIIAEDASNNPLTGYTDLVGITVSTNHGNWSVNDADNVTSPNPDSDDNGAVNYTFVLSDVGEIVLDLTNTHAETLTIEVEDPFLGITSTSVPITFGDNVFVITEDPVQVAGRPQSMNLAMWTNDGSSCFINPEYNSPTQSIEASIDRAGVLLAANDPTIAAISIPDGPATATISLDFSVTPGQVNFNLNSSDVGQYRLMLVDITNGFSDQPIAGIGNRLTVRPFGISVTGIMAGATVNPGGSAPTDAIFTAAGNNFEAIVAGVLWDAADDGNNDGILDTGVFAGNTVAPSYAWDTTLSVSGAGFTPSTGVPGVLVNGTALLAEFGGGTFNITDLQYTEVGSFTLQSTALDFLGMAGLDIFGDDIIVGRFTPASLLISSTVDGAFINTNVGGLIPYTYIGQRFSYDPAARPSFVVSALNAAGSPTLNYTGAWAKLAAASVSLSGPTSDSTALGSDAVTLMAVTYTQDAADFSVNDLGGGNIEFVFTDDDFVYDKDANSEVPPFNPEVDLIISDVTDADTITNSGPTILTPDGSSVELRFGRLRMENAFGSELDDLIMNYHLEYYDVIGITPFWTRHDDADTTVIAPGDINAVPGNTAATAINPTLLPGKHEITLSAPLLEVLETITNQVDSSGEPWLQYDWDEDGLFDNNPTALATFGIFEGDPVQIYIQQIYQ